MVVSVDFVASSSALELCGSVQPLVQFIALAGSIWVGVGCTFIFHLFINKN